MSRGRAPLEADWFPDWGGDVAAVVASGESATHDDVNQLRGRARVLVVNNSYQLAPWADAIYAADRQWWENNRDALAFGGLKVTSKDNVARRYGVRCVQVMNEAARDAHEIRIDRSCIIGHGGNSGFQALNLAIQFGACRILLVGFDFCGSHWHGDHKEPLRNPRPQKMLKWAARLDAQAPRLANLGIEIINCSSVSALTAFNRMTLTDGINRWCDKVAAA